MMLASAMGALGDDLAKRCRFRPEPMSGEAVMLMITPRAPAIVVSSRGLEMAAMAACSALSLPPARPTPMWA